MFSTLFNKFRKPSFKQVAEKELKENLRVIESLRDYDIGKKQISTRNLERRLPNIRVAP